MLQASDLGRHVKASVVRLHQLLDDLERVFRTASSHCGKLARLATSEAALARVRLRSIQLYHDTEQRSGGRG